MAQVLHVGDPIELKALGAVLAEDRTSGEKCNRWFSLKTNIGHTEGAGWFSRVNQDHTGTQTSYVASQLTLLSSRTLIYLGVNCP